MLIARAPVRISFAGGGTDLPGYYRRFGGTVISTSIDKYLYAVISQSVPGNILQFISADYQTSFSYNEESRNRTNWQGDLALSREVLNYFRLIAGLNIFMASEIPPGTGLGSSSAAAVCLGQALSAFTNQQLTKQELAELACLIEIEKLGRPIGKQDQYASAFGGFNQLEFFPDETVRVTPLNLAGEVLEALQKRLMLFYTGVSRYSTSILGDQEASVRQAEKEVLERLHTIKELAGEVKKALQTGDLNTFGELLHQGWLEKKRLASKITNNSIDEIYKIARHSGAQGGKLTGAGGGGYLLLYCLPEYQSRVNLALQARGLQRLYFSFEEKGAHILLGNEAA